MKKVIISSAIALTFGFAAVSSVFASYTFSNYLTVGSTGADVTALQSWLVSNSFLTMPAGVSMGYFGSLTKAAVIAYQASVGLPNTGFVGPLTVAKLNAAGGSSMTMSSCPAGYSCTQNAPTTTFTCPAGWTCTAPNGSATTGSSVTTTTSVGTITTPGAEGILSVTAGPISNSVLTAGQLKAPILDARLQAQDSDIAIQRVAVDLGTSTNIFNYVYTNMYLIDPTTGSVLAWSPLNSSTVVQSGTQYVINLTGFNFVVPKNTYKDLQVAVDLQPTILSQFTSANTVGIDGNGVRGIDGAGIVQYGPAGAGTDVISQTISINQSLALTSQVNVSLDGNTPPVNAVPVTDTTNGNYLGLPVMIFDVLAQNDNMHIHNLVIKFTSNATSSITAAYLYQGSTLLTSAAVNSSNGTATFSNLPDSGTGSAIIPINTSQAYTIKADITNVKATPLTVTAAFQSSGSTFYNSTDGTANTVNGSALANTITVLGTGPGLVLNTAPAAAVQGTNVDGSTNSATSTAVVSANFNINVTAVGSNVFFNGQGTSTPVFTFNVYDQNGNILAQGTTGTTTITGTAASSLPTSGLTVPTGSSIINLGNGQYEIPQGATVTLAPTFTFSGRYGNSAHITTPVTVGLAGFTYESSAGNSSSITATSTFMAASTAWRTNTVTAN